MRGYFGVGVEGLSKPVNAANLFRTAHAFGAGFVFTIGATYPAREAMLDTSRAIENIPYYAWEGVEEAQFPKGCSLIGIEFLDTAYALPSFHHPSAAAYVMGAERGSLSPALLNRTAHIVKIPTAFCINLAVAGAIVMYDRLLTHGRFGQRPALPGGKIAPPPAPRFGRPTMRKPPPGNES